MIAVGDTWSGDDWQLYCHQLLGLRYGPSYQRVPDRDRGDLGIEGFTSDGTVFQCYAAQNPRTLEELHTKQRDKMTADLNKLEKNCNTICALTAPANIRFWVFLVPRCDTKRLILHASSKAAEFRNKGLTSLDSSFSVRVWTDEDLSPEKQTLVAVGKALLPRPVPEPSDADVVSWTESKPEGTSELERKIANLPTVLTLESQEQLRAVLVKRYLAGVATLDQIRSSQPQMWERINHEREQRERLLLGSRLLAVDEERETIRDEISRIHSRLELAVPALTGGLAENLAWGTVAEWLIRCPLEPALKATD